MAQLLLVIVIINIFMEVSNISNIEKFKKVLAQALGIKNFEKITDEMGRTILKIGIPWHR